MKYGFQRISALLLALLLTLTLLPAAALADNPTLTVSAVGVMSDGTRAPVAPTGEGVTATGQVEAGQQVTLNPGAVDTYQFSHWESVSGGGMLDDPFKGNAKYTMPGENAEIRAVFTVKTPVKLTIASAAGGTYQGSVSPATVGAVSAALLSDASVATLTKDCVLTYQGTSVDYGPSTEKPTAAGGYTVFATTAADESAYYGVSLPVSFTIEKKVLHVSGITAANRAYDGTTDIALSGTPAWKDIASEWLEGGTPPVLNAAGAAGAVADKNASETPKAVAVSGLAMDVSNANYVIEPEGALTVVIGKYPVTAQDVAWTGADARDYNGAASNVTAAIQMTGGRLGDTATLTLSGNAEANVGTHTASVTGVTGDSAANYDVATNLGALTKQYVINRAVLSGSVSVTSAGSIARGSVLSANLSGLLPALAQTEANALTYQWKRAGTAIAGATTNSYTIAAEDLGKAITLAVTGSGNFSGTVESGAASNVGQETLSGSIGIAGNSTVGSLLTATPSLNAGITASEFTLQWYAGGVAVSGANALTYTIQPADAGKNISVMATAVAGASARYTGSVSSGNFAVTAQGPGAPVIDVATIPGQLTVSWNEPATNGYPITGYTLAITQVGGAGNTFTIDPSARSYTVTGIPGGVSYSVVLTARNAVSATSSAASTVLIKSRYTGGAPSAPTRYSRTSTKITLTPHGGYEYSRDGSSWQSSNIFTGLKASTTYSFYQRVAETATTGPSAASAVAKLATSSSSSSSGSSSSGSSSSGSGSSGSSSSGSSSSGSSSSGSSSSGSSSSGSGSSGSGSTGTTETDTLFQLNVTESNSNILFSTMNKLVKGNATQDVTLEFPSVVYTFQKGTLSAESGRVWYDFGVSLNNCAHNNAVKALAGDAFVMTVHYNWSGALPGKATVKIYVGSAYANQQLYYYKYNETAGTLEFLQAVSADAQGWANVNQESCSDYVFTSRDLAAPAATETPTVTETPAPTASPEVIAPAATKKNGPNWVLIGIIAAAAGLFIAIIWLWLRRTEDDEEAYDEELDNGADDYGPEDGYDDGYEDDYEDDDGYPRKR